MSHPSPETRPAGAPLRSVRDLARRIAPRWVNEARHVVRDLIGAGRGVASIGDRVVLGRAARGTSTRAAPTTVHLRPLDGAPFVVRPGTSDARVVLDTFVGMYHLPPSDLRPRVIWDLGSNLGATVAHYAVMFPDATITGVEAQPDLVELARSNLAPWAGRCSVVEGAVWSSDGRLEFVSERGDEFGGHVKADADATTKSYTVRAHSLTSLLADVPRVDYVKIDIEGAERSLFTENTAWADKVRCLKVEVHPPYTLAECTRDLELLGFSVEEFAGHWSCLVARRD